MFPDYESCFMPPFGNLHGMHVYVDEHLTKDEEVAFNARAHWKMFKMSYKGFVKLV